MEFVRTPPKYRYCCRTPFQHLGISFVNIYNLAGRTRQTKRKCNSNQRSVLGHLETNLQSSRVEARTRQGGGFRKAALNRRGRDIYHVPHIAFGHLLSSREGRRVCRFGRIAVRRKIVLFASNSENHLEFRQTVAKHRFRQIHRINNKPKPITNFARGSAKDFGDNNSFLR